MVKSFRKVVRPSLRRVRRAPVSQFTVDQRYRRSQNKKVLKFKKPLLAWRTRARRRIAQRRYIAGGRKSWNARSASQRAALIKLFTRIAQSLRK